MMSAPRRPLIVARLLPDRVYYQAQGIELYFDNEWPVTLVVLAQPEDIEAVTGMTDVTSLGVQVGVTDMPTGEEPLPQEVGWVLTRPDKLAVALASGRNLLVTEGTDLSGLTADERGRIAVVTGRGEVHTVRSEYPEVFVLLVNGTAANCRAGGVDGLFLDEDFGAVIEVCKGLANPE
jgi:hypothetical protein